MCRGGGCKAAFSEYSPCVMQLKARLGVVHTHTGWTGLPTRADGAASAALGGFDLEVAGRVGDRFCD